MLTIPIRRLRAALATVATTLLAAILLAPPALAQKPPVSGGRVAAEVGVGTILMPVGFLAGGLGTRWVARHAGADPARASSLAMAGAWTGSALATAAGPTLIGTRGVTTGSYPAAVGGAVVGGAASYLLVRFGKHALSGEPCHLTCIVTTAAIALLPSVGATVGFNLSRRYE